MKKYAFFLFNAAFYAAYFFFYIRILLLDEFHYYVHPSMKVFSWVLFAFFFVFAIETLYSAFYHKRRKFNAQYLIFLLPLIMLLGFESKKMSIMTISQKSGSFTGSTKKMKKSDSNTNGAYKNGIYATNAIKLYNSYLHVYWGDETKHLGKRVTVQGVFVTNNRQLYPNQGIVGRLAVVCCVPHARLAGFYVQFDKLPPITNEAWVKVSGELILSKIKVGRKPVVFVDTWEEIPSEDAYMYAGSYSE